MIGREHAYALVRDWLEESAPVDRDRARRRPRPRQGDPAPKDGAALDADADDVVRYLGGTG